MRLLSMQSPRLAEKAPTLFFNLTCFKCGRISFPRNVEKNRRLLTHHSGFQSCSLLVYNNRLNGVVVEVFVSNVVDCSFGSRSDHTKDFLEMTFMAFPLGVSHKR